MYIYIYIYTHIHIYDCIVVSTHIGLHCEYVHSYNYMVITIL